MSEFLGVVDAHHHVWAPSRFRYAWLDPAAGGLAADYLPAGYVADTAAVRVGGPVRVLGSVLVEAGRDDPVAEAAWLAAADADFPHPVAVVGRVRLQDPAVGDRLDELAAAGVRGVRQVLNPPDPALGAAQYAAEAPDLMDDPDWRRGLARLAPRGLTFDLQVLPPQLAAAAELAGAYPDLTFVLDHAGYTTARTAELDQVWRAGLTALAARPNVLVKASDYSTMDPSMDPAGFRAFVRELVGVFGPRRVLFGSNFPNEGRRIGFSALVERFADALAGLTVSDRTAVLSGNAAGVYFSKGATCLI